MPFINHVRGQLRKLFILNGFTIVLLLFLLILAIVLLVYQSQALVERDAFGAARDIPPSETKQQYEVDKLRAEIRQIRSETSGSRFWLQMITLFVTVGGAVGGYLLGQRRTVRERILYEEKQAQNKLDFELRRDVDAAYQAIVQELSGDNALLRAAAAVKLGALLRSFPIEWQATPERRAELVHLTKQILAACLAIETEKKVRKTLTIALVLHKRRGIDPVKKTETDIGIAGGLDLSGAVAGGAYWSLVDFTDTEFFGAQLPEASLRKSSLDYAQFREANLSKAVLAGAHGQETNFTLCNLHDADLSGIKLVKANFEGAKVYGVKLAGAELLDTQGAVVDVSPPGGAAEEVGVADWLASHPDAPSIRRPT